MGMHLHEMVSYLDELLGIPGFRDYPNALNGLQVENSGSLSRIGAAVDACEQSIREAAAAGVDLLVVHHGLYWGGLSPLTGSAYRKARIAIEADMAIYSAHLPLDAHPRLGNNALLAERLGLAGGEPFFPAQGEPIGQKFDAEINREVLRSLLEKAVGGPVHLAPGGPALCKKIGVVTGGAGAEVARAASEGIDTMVTGEGPHWSFTAAEELGINLFYAGHYATETFGVKALATELSERFALPWEFIDHPTGL